MITDAISNFTYKVLKYFFCFALRQVVILIIIIILRIGIRIFLKHLS